MATLLVFRKPHRLSQLHDEILAAHPTLAGVVRVTGTGDDLQLLLPDGVADPGLTALVTAHTPLTDAEWERLGRRAGGKVEFDERLVLRALVGVLLDEINLLRNAVVPPLAPRTPEQARTAIRNKIDSGPVD